MRTLRLAAILVFALCSALAGAQTTTVTATLNDPSGTVWANATWTATVISSLNPPVTLPGYNSFTTTYAGTANASGSFSVTVQSVANIFPANATWQFCVVSGVSFTQQFCVNVPVGNVGQSSQDISTQINAVLTNPVVNGGFAIRAYNDMEVTGYPGAMYYNIVSNVFRCYTITWGPCSVGSGATTPATMLVLKGGGTTNSVLPAVPGVDYVLPSGSITGTAANLSGTPVLPNGTTAITQATGDASNRLATDLFVSQAVGSGLTTPATNLLLKGNGSVNGVIAGVPGTDYLLPLANANVLGSTSGGALTAATSAQIVAALNASPSATLSTVLFPYYAQPGDTIASIESACSSGCTYIVAIPQTFTLSGSHALSSNVNPVFLAAGKWTVNGGGSTLTIPSHVDGTLTQHFAGTAAIRFGNSQPIAPVEWFGAVGDWNGSSGTDNTAAIQSCLNAIQNGQCALQAQAYKTTATLTITRSQVGLIGTSPGFPNAAFWAVPSPSEIIITSALADDLDAVGVSTTNTISENLFTNFTLARSVVPTTGSAGLKLAYSYGARVTGVSAEDANVPFYLHAVGSAGVGYFENCGALFGYNGVTETSGVLAGFQIDSLDGSPSPSLRIRNSFTVANTPLTGTTTYGLLANGSATNDLMLDHFETATVNYGVSIQSSGGASTDIHLINGINDGCITSCIYIIGISTGSVEVSGGWNYRQSSAGPVIDIRNSSHVDITNLQLYYPAGTGVGVSASISGSLRISHNDFISGGNSAITFSSVSASTITGNVMNGITATSIISLANSPGTVISSNNINGTATNGILMDANSSGVGGLETNQIGLPALGTITNIINNAGTNQTTFCCGAQISLNGSIYKIRQFTRQTASPLCSAAANGSCTFTVTFPRAFLDASWMGSCMVETSTGTGGIVSIFAAGKTTTAATATFRDFSGATNAVTSVTCEGWE